MKKMLLIGNGVSRKKEEIQKFIEEWQDEIWIFNYAYKEYGKKATRWSGHVELIQEANKYKKRYKCNYDIYTNAETIIPHKNFDHLYLFDSGTTALRQALLEEYDCWLVGYDLGGADIYSPEHYKINKTGWVKRMYQIWFNNQDRIHFIGVDHSEIFRSRKFWLYYEKYSKGINHLE